MDGPPRLSDRIEGWLRGDQAKTLGDLVSVFGEKSFAVLFVLLLAVPALPLPTGGVTHLFELVAMLLSLELIVGRREVWLPRRLREVELMPLAQRRFSELLLARIRWLEDHSRPRLAPLLAHRITSVLYGVVVLALSATAFLAPPFTGLDTLPAMGVVVISVGILLEDSLIALIGIAIGLVGAAVVIGLGGLAVDAARDLL